MLSHVQLFANPWTAAHQALLPIGFPKQEYWSGLAFPPPGDWTLISYIFCIGRWIFLPLAPHGLPICDAVKLNESRLRCQVNRSKTMYNILLLNMKQTVIKIWKGQSSHALFPSPCQNKGINLYFRMLCGSLDGRGVRGKTDTCICMAEPLCCLPETVTTSLISYGLVTKSCLRSHGL